jgi:hypothetical protein
VQTVGVQAMLNMVDADFGLVMLAGVLVDRAC